MSRLPAYCVHKGRNLAYVTIRGREHYLGRAHPPSPKRVSQETVQRTTTALPDEGTH